MNDDGIQLLSTIMGLLFLCSVALAAVVLWVNARGRRAAMPEHGRASQPRTGTAPEGETRRS